MSDCVAIAAELPFRQQVSELALHISRSLPTSADPASAQREFVASFESQLPGGASSATAQEGAEAGSSSNAEAGASSAEEAVDEETRKKVVRALVGKVGELRGALEATRESESESAHLLLQHVVASTFSGEEFEELERSIVDAVQKGAEANASAGRMTRVDAACRILNNTYNFLPASSRLRPPTLLALLGSLSRSADLSDLPLTPAFLSASLSQWSISEADKVAFLGSASAIYEQASNFSKALDLLVLALRSGAGKVVAERAIVLALADEDRFSLESVLGLEGVSQAVEGGKMGELVQLFADEDATAAVTKGEEWVKANDSFISGFTVPSFSGEAVLRKLRLIALASLCSNSQTKVLSYSEVASAIKVDAAEVEMWVIDAIRASLLNARLHQPSQTIRVESVSAAAASSRRFGSEQWQTLERRLHEWKKAVDEARDVVKQAQEQAQQGLGNNYQGQQGQGRRGRDQQQQQQQQAVPAAKEEISA